MKWITFGDLHLNKPFPDLIATKNTKFNNVEDIYAYGLKLYILDIINKVSDNKANVVFIGDITHYNQDKFDRFLDIVDNILTVKPDFNIFVLIGNHDTSNSYKLEKAKINKLNGYRNKLTVIKEIQLLSSNNANILFLPYIRTEYILPTIQQYRTTNNLVILSHNNIYTTKYWGSKEVVTFSEIKSINENIRLINGHIHRFSIEKDYYQIGSAAPTSFKEYFYAVGCCVFDDISLKFNVFKNTKLFFISVNNSDYIKEARNLLKQTEKHNTIVFLNTPFKELYNYKTVMVVKNENFFQKS